MCLRKICCGCLFIFLPFSRFLQNSKSYLNNRDSWRFYLSKSFKSASSNLVIYFKFFHVWFSSLHLKSICIHENYSQFIEEIYGFIDKYLYVFILYIFDPNECLTTALRLSKFILLLQNTNFINFSLFNGN